MAKVTLNPERWSFEDWSKYLQATQDGDFEQAFIVLRPMIAAWEFDAPLEGDRPDLKLPMGALPEIMWAVRATIDRFSDDLDITGVAVDLNRSNMEQFYTYLAALKSGDVKVIEDYFKLVCTYKEKDYDPKARLSLRHGLMFRKAVEKQTEHIFRKR